MGGKPQDRALALHTSGTTSRPKMVALSQGNLCASACHVQAALALTEEDRCLNVMPLFHIHGLIGALLSSLVAGGSVVCTSGFDAEEFFTWIKEFQPTWYTAVPTMHQAVLSLAQASGEVLQPHSLRLIRSCSAALAPGLMRGLEEVLGVPVIEAYGMTEAAHQIASNPLPPRQRKPGSVGLAAGPEVSVVDEDGNRVSPEEIGEIVIRGPNVMSSYADNPEGNTESFANGWFRTGDQGYLDAEGYLFITGRLKEMINRGGEKISPKEVDEMLMQHPAVAQAVSFAVPHATLGEDVAAAVVLRKGSSTTESKLQQFASVRIAEFKVPRRVVFVSEIPRGATGKVQRHGLAERLRLTKPDEAAKQAAGAEYAAPRNPIEEKLVEIWSEVLRVPRVGIHDNFFVLGGDSIVASQILVRVRETLHAELSFHVFFEAPTVAGMAAGIQPIGSEAWDRTVPPIARTPRDWELPLSFAQQRLWFLDQYEPNSSVYNIPSALRLRGSLNIGALEQSLNEILCRHESLRTTFSMVEGEAVQVIAPPVGFSLAVVDLRDHLEREREEEARRLAREEALRPFDLARGPLFRSQLLRLGEDDHVLLLTMHHIVSDGWSMGVLHHELSVLYEAFSQSQPSPLPELSIQYADYAVWQREWLRGEVLDRQLSYWKKQLEGIPEDINLPTDRPRSVGVNHREGHQSLVLSKDLSERLKVLGRKEGVTLYMTLLAAFKALLYQYTGQTDLVIGSPIAGRNCPEIEGLIGFFVNTLVLRSNLSGNPSFRELLKRVREACLGAYAHQELPYQKLVEALGPKRNTGLGSLVRVFFAFQNVPRQSLKLPDLTVTPLRTDVRRPTAALTLFMWEAEESLAGSLNYIADLFNAATINRMVEHFQTLLNAVVADPERRLLDFSPFLEHSRSELLDAIHWATEQSWHFEIDTTAGREQGEI